MVKKVLSAVALASVVAAAPAMAQTGGFTGPGATQEGTVAGTFRVISTNSRMPPAPSNLKSTANIGTVRTSSPKIPLS